MTLRRRHALGLLALLGSTLPAVHAAHADAKQPPSSSSSYSEQDLFKFMAEELDVTTASRMKTKVSEAPQPVFVITAAEIKQLAPTNIADLLAYVPSGTVAHATGSQWGVTIHIGPAPLVTSFLLVMIDGRRVYSTFADLTQWWPLPVAPEDIQRVEVAFGASSTLYGPQAVYGVMNFITKRPKKTGYTYSVSGGGSLADNGTVRGGDARVYASTSQVWSRARLRLATAYERLTPWDSAPLSVDGRLVPPRPAQRVIANSRIELTLGPTSKLNIMAGGSVYESNYVTFGRSRMRGASEYLDGKLVFTSLLSSQDHLELRANVRTQQLALATPFDPLLPAVDMNNDTVIATVQGLYRISLPAANRLIAGFEGTASQYDWRYLEPAGQHRGELGLFVQDEYRPIEPLIFTAGVRVQTQLLAKAHFTDRLRAIPRASAVFVDKGQSLRVSYGEGIFYPSPMEDYANVTVDHGTVPLLESSRTLLPSPYVRALEVGYRGVFFNSLVVTLSYTNWWISNLTWILPVGSGPLPVYTTGIAGIQQRQSLDFSLSWQLLSKLRVDLCFSKILRNAMPKAFAKRVGLDLFWVASARVHYAPMARLDITLAASALGPRVDRDLLLSQAIKVAGWIDLNAQVSWRLLAKPELEVFAVGSNITNTLLGQGVAKEVPDPAASTVGRRFEVGLRGQL